MQTHQNTAGTADITTADSASRVSAAVAMNRKRRRAAKYGLNAKGSKQRELLQSLRLSGKGRAPRPARRK